jgi:hypothetical protein
MDDSEILAEIHRLVTSEHKLREPGAAHSPAEIKQVEILLDECWDLLRQRRAREEFGENPQEAKAREEAVVEHYQQ